MLGSAALTLAGLLWFLMALRRSPISLTIPLLSFTPVMAMLRELPVGVRRGVRQPCLAD